MHRQTKFSECATGVTSHLPSTYAPPPPGARRLPCNLFSALHSPELHCAASFSCNPVSGRRRERAGADPGWDYEISLKPRYETTHFYKAFRSLAPFRYAQQVGGTH